MKIIALILFSFAFLNSAISVEYYPFPTQNARWYTSLSGVFCLPAPSPCNFGETIFEGDTIINNNLYSKIYQLSKDGESPIYKNYLGGFRNSGKKVFYFRDFTQEEIVLYDFTMQLNDTVSFSFTLDTAVVVSIDSILIGTDYRKRFNLESLRSNEEVYFYPYSIIEGIGSINGLFAGPNAYTGFEDGWHILTCFWENGEVVYNPDGEECYELSSINDPASLNNGVSIFPNPSDGMISIENIQSSVEIDFFDMLGNHVLHEIVYQDGQLDLNHLNDGMYIVRLSRQELIYSYKLLLSK